MRLNEEWISPRRFRGVAGTEGVLIVCNSRKLRNKWLDEKEETHVGKSRGSESGVDPGIS